MVWGGRRPLRGTSGQSSATDLVPSLLGMYDALVARTSGQHDPREGKQQQHHVHQADAEPSPGAEGGRRPLSVASTASSCCSSTSSTSSSSTSTSSSSATPGGDRRRAGGGGGCAEGHHRRSLRSRKSSLAYLASVESLGDDELSSLCDEEEEDEGCCGGEGGEQQKTAVLHHHRRRIGATNTSGGARALQRGLPSSGGASTLPPYHHLRQPAGRRGGGLFSAQASGCAKQSVGAGDRAGSAPTSCSHISAPTLPTGPRPRYCDPNLSYMDRVVMEIAETEAVYVRDLQQIIEGYLHRWRSSEDCPIGSKQLKDLFGNIEDIFLFNSEFLCELEQCGLDPVKVAKTFVKNNNGFSIYTDYCTNYPRTVSLLTELMRRELTVRLFRERQSFLQHSLPLGSYLLKPVQRILKYHLLLQNIVKHFGKESEGYRDIADALSAMTGIAHHINEMKRKHEHAIRVQEIQSLLYGWEGEDLTTYGELCAEGAFRMYGAKAMRHAFLFDRMLLLTKRKEEGILMYKAHIMCSNLMLIESVPGEPLSFHVIPFDNPRLQYTLQARNLEQKREWALQLKRVILENYNAVIPTHARQLVMELGQNRTDDEILAEKSTPKRQHSAPEYLERRKQERRKSETGLLLRHRLRRSNRKDSSGGACVVTDGLSSKEPSPSVQRRGGRRAQSVSRDRNDSVSSCGQEGEGVQRGGAATLPFGATAEKVKDRFGSWRRKSEPSYLSSKGGTSVGHLSIYVSPDFIERSSDSLALGTCSSSRKDEAEKEEVISVASNDPEQEKRIADAAVSSSEGGAQVGSAGADHLPQSDGIAQEDEEGAEACSRRESLEEIVGQLLMQSHHFQRMLSTRQRRRAQHGTAKSRQHAREEEEEGDCGDNKGTQCALPPPPLPPQQDPPTTSSNKFRAQREAHMRALREQQRRMSVISISNGVVQEAGPNKDPPSFFSPSAVSCRDDDCVAESPLNGGHEQGDDANHYDNLLDVWARVHQEGPTPGIVVDPKGGSWRPPEEGDNSPTAEWLKQQDLSHTNSPLKAGSLPRGFSLLSTQHQRPPPHASTFASTSPGGSACDHPPPFRMDRPFSIASESPARADEIDFEDIEQYMAETGLGVSSFLSPRFPLSPLIADHHQDNDSIVASADDGRVQGADQDEDDEDDEDDVTSVAQINVHPDYRIYRPSVSRTALRHVISSVSNKLANLRLNASSGGITTEDDDEDGLGGVGEGGNARRRKRNSSSSRAVRGSCPNSLNSTFGLVSGDSESESVKGGAGGSSWLVKTLARHYSRGLKDRIRSIMTMNNAAVVGASSSHLNLEPDNDQSAKGEDVPSPRERSPSQDQSNAGPPATKTTPYHKQGSSGLGARIAHGSEVPEYATPHVCGIGKGKAKEEEDACSRPDSLLSATSSAFTSSSDGDNRTLSGAGTTRAAQESKAMPIRCNVLISAEDDDDEDDDDEYAVGSGDSYYERSFEAIESMITMDANVGSAEATEGNVFRDSAIFSDHEEADTIAARLSGSPPKTTFNCSLARLPMPTAVSRSAASLSSKIPPPVPAKPRASNVAATASVAACAPRVSCGASGSRVSPQAAPPTAQLSVKSVHQRRRELEMRGNYGNSYSSVDVAQCGLEGGRGGISSEEVVDDSAMPKGWVRHVVGKLQNGD